MAWHTNTFIDGGALDEYLKLFRNLPAVKEYWHLFCYQRLLDTSISVLYIPNSLHYPLKCKRIYASYTIIFQVLETINIYITDKKS
jgi:hypothetical protein